MAVSRPLRGLFISAVIFAVALSLHLQFGFGWDLDRDAALYSYAGRLVAEGDVPYESVFDVKGPYASIIPAVGVWIANIFGLYDLTGIRLQFMIISALTAAGVFLLGRELSRCNSVGIFAATTFIGFQGFLYQASGGGRPKTAVVMLMVFALLTALRHRWLAAGVLSTLGALTWQPTAFVWAALAVSGLSVEARSRRGIAFFLIGTAAVLSVTILYFWHHNALSVLFEGAVAALFLIDRDPQTLASHVLHPIHAMFGGFQASFVALALGFVTLLATGLQAIIRWNSRSPSLLCDRWMPFYATFGMFTAWSLVDFQGYDDGFPLLPHLAICFGGLLNGALVKYTGDAGGKPERLRQIGVVLLFIAVIAPITVEVKFRPGSGLQAQQDAVEEIMEELDGGRLLALDAPEVLVLGNVRSVSRHVVIMTGIDDIIDRTEFGGFEGWIAALDESEIDMVVWQAPQGKHIPKLRRWVTSEFKFWRKLETWEIFVRD